MLHALNTFSKPINPRAREIPVILLFAPTELSALSVSALTAAKIQIKFLILFH